MLDAFPAHEPLEKVCLLRLKVRWDQLRDRLADHFLGRVTEQPFRARIPARDDAAEILALTVPNFMMALAHLSKSDNDRSASTPAGRERSTPFWAGVGGAAVQTQTGSDTGSRD